MKISNPTNKQNKNKILNVFKILADVTKKQLNMIMFLDTYQSLIVKKCLFLK